MRACPGSIFAIAVVGAGIVPAATAEEPIAESAAVTYAADTTGSPRTITDAAAQTELAEGWWKVTWRSGETVTMTGPDGTATTLSDGSSAGSAIVSFDAGGLWTVENSRQGTAAFTVRHSLYGTLGEGTEVSPARLVDGDELLDYSAGDGYVFTLEGDDSLFAALTIPEGYRLTGAGDGAWKIVSSPDGGQYIGAQVAYAADSKQKGPNRKIPRRHIPPVSCSDDVGKGDAASAATLTFVSPRGVETSYSLTGADALMFDAWETGVWTVTLETATGARTATVTVQPGTVIVIR